MKKYRRSKADIQTIKSEIFNALAVENPMTLRQLFYRLVSAGIIEKSEKEYKGTIGRLATEMRMSGELPFEWFADNSRWMRKPISYNSLEQCLNNTIRNYRLDLWQNQKDYVEIWMEKDALTGVLIDVTSEFDVPLMVTKGYCSLSYAHEAAQTFSRLNKPTYIYYLGDFDASGKDIPRDLEAKLRTFAPSANIHFESIAVTDKQIKDWSLPTRPSKTTDTRKFNSKYSVEVDAIPPKILKDLVRNVIEKHIDTHQLQQIKIEENSQKETVKYMIDLYNSNVTGLDL